MRKTFLKKGVVVALILVGLLSANIPINAATTSGMSPDGYKVSAYNLSINFGGEKSYEWNTIAARTVSRISVTYTIKNNATGGTIFPSMTRNVYNGRRVDDYMSPNTSDYTSVTTANFSSHSSVYTSGYVLYLSTVA